MTSNFNFILEDEVLRNDQKLIKQIEIYEEQLIKQSDTFTFGNWIRTAFEEFSARYFRDPVIKKVGKGNEHPNWYQTWRNTYQNNPLKFKKVKSILNLLSSLGNIDSHNSKFKFEFSSAIMCLRAFHSLLVIFVNHDDEAFNEDVYFIDLPNETKITAKLDLHLNDSFNGTLTINKRNFLGNERYSILRWRDYSDTWTEFCQKIQQFQFDKAANFRVNVNGEWQQFFLSENYSINEIETTENVVFCKKEKMTILEKPKTFIVLPKHISYKVEINMWRNNEYIYLNISTNVTSIFGNKGVIIKCSIGELTFW